MFEAQVQRTPEAIAAIFGEEKLTYQELNYRANQLAHYLVKRGVGSEVLVGICMERSVEMVVGLLGNLKAGGTYVPLAPEYPNEKLAFMLQDAQVSVLLTQKQLVKELPEHEAHVICLDTDWKCITSERKDNPSTKTTANSLAYVIHTSGSAGNPKGVCILHSSVISFLRSMRRQPGLAKEDILIAVTTLSFDIAALELFLPLTVVAQVVLVSRGAVKDGLQLIQILVDSGATVMQATPAAWRILIESGWQGSPNLKSFVEVNLFLKNLLIS